MGLNEKMKSLFEKFKLPLLVLILGIFLMMLPGGSQKENHVQEPEYSLQELLCRTRGVGDARVLISENGAVIVCEGAEDPRVRLDIIRAVGSYTGFGSDRITILKLADNA